MTRKLYAGAKGGMTYELFRSESTPTQASHGDIYLFALGPYHTIGEAMRAMDRLGMRYDAPPMAYQVLIDA